MNIQSMKDKKQAVGRRLQVQIETDCKKRLKRNDNWKETSY